MQRETADPAPISGDYRFIVTGLVRPLVATPAELSVM